LAYLGGEASARSQALTNGTNSCSARGMSSERQARGQLFNAAGCRHHLHHGADEEHVAPIDRLRRCLGQCKPQRVTSLMARKEAPSKMLHRYKAIGLTLSELPTFNEIK
jgi:hypothetical protein